MFLKSKRQLCKIWPMDSTRTQERSLRMLCIYMYRDFYSCTRTIITEPVFTFKQWKIINFRRHHYWILSLNKNFLTQISNSIFQNFTWIFVICGALWNDNSKTQSTNQQNNFLIVSGDKEYFPWKHPLPRNQCLVSGKALIKSYVILHYAWINNFASTIMRNLHD